MTDQDAGSDDAARPWWHGPAESLPDIDALLGDEAMEAVGTAADEALKLFVVLRERFVEAGAQASAAGPEEAAPEQPWATVLGQLAATAVRAVNDLAASAGQAMGPLPAAPPRGQAAGPPPGSGTDDGAAGPGAGPSAPRAGAAGEPVVLPGQAAACSYCPLCQAIALFRSVPMSTWQRLAASVVEVADAAREFTGGAPQQSRTVVVTAEAAPATAGPVSVEDVLADLAGSADAGDAAPDAPSGWDAEPH